MFLNRAAASVRIIRTLVMHDIQTRIGASYLGFAVAIMWPLTHLGVIVAVRALVSKMSPAGDNPIIFFGTGVLPYILCLYPARLMAMTISQKKYILAIPIVNPVQLMFARAVVEIIIALIVGILFWIILTISGIDFVPYNIHAAVQAIGASIYLGITIGIFNAVMGASLGAYYVILFYFVMIGLFIVSGAYFPVYLAPEKMKVYIEYDPLYHLVNWFRSAYYVDQTLIEFDRMYIFKIGAVSLFLGLFLERMLRGKLLR